MNFTCKVSVVVPTYNRADVLPETIDSVLAQTYKDYEIIIVDDGSTDNTREILEPYLSMDNISYVYQENKKQASARNKGIQNSKGEYIAFLDSDDLWHPRKLEYQVEIFEKHPDIGMVYSNQSIIQDDPYKEKIKYPLGKLKSGFIFEDLLLRKFYCSTPSLLIRRSVLDDVGLLDESLEDAFEDWELTLRISKKYKVFCLDKPLFRRRINIEYSGRYFEKRIKNHKKILDKYLNESDLETPYRNSIWGKANFSWAHIYLTNHCYGKAIKYFFQASCKGHKAAIVAVPLCLLGPVGIIIFEYVYKQKLMMN